MTSPYRLLIGGQLVAGASSYDVINPATEQVIASCPRADEAQLHAAIAAAQAAFPAWAARTQDDRAALIDAVADRLLAEADVFARLLTSEQGKPLDQAHYEIMATVFTLRGIAQMRVEDRTLKLEQAMRQMESFSYSISHDLRAPLRAINGFSHILQETEASHLSEEGRRLLERIMKNANRMGELIDDVLAYSRVTRAELHLTDISMAGIAGAVANELGEQHPAARIDIGPLPPCRGDAAMLRELWTNLIDNALKFSGGRAAPLVEIGFARNAETQLDEYFIRDNGVGFDMRYAGELFGVFQRMHGAQSFQGTGVGLSIVKRIIERHLGHIRAEATPEVGAAFYFSIGDPDASAP